LKLWLSLGSETLGWGTAISDSLFNVANFKITDNI